MPTTRDNSGPIDIATMTRDIVRGNHAAFDAFYSRWFTLAYAVARACTRADESTCLDVVQEVMLRVIKAIPIMHSATDVDRWLAHVTRRAAIDHMRRNARAVARDAISTRVDAAPHASDELARLSQAFATLDPRDAEILMLRFSGGLTLEQLAQLTGGSKDATHGRVRRALAALRTLLSAATHPASLLALVILHSRGCVP